MKKIYSLVFITTLALNCYAQLNGDKNSVQMRVQGIWQNEKDSNNLLVVTGDSIYTHNLQPILDNVLITQLAKGLYDKRIARWAADTSGPKAFLNTAVTPNEILAGRTPEIRCGYDIEEEACTSTMKVAVTGKYLAERFKNKVVCASIDEASYSALKLVFADGTTVVYHFIADM